MKKLLLLYLLSQTSISFGQTEAFHDLINHTAVHYTTKDLDIGEFDLKMKEVTYIELKEDKWPGAKKINELILKQAKEIGSTEFASRFEREYNKAIEQALIGEYDECVRTADDPKSCGRYFELADGMLLEELAVNFFITSLSNNILIGGMNISFDARHKDVTFIVEDLGFQYLHYYDLNTGQEIDPKTILNTKKLAEFHKLVKSRVPEALKPMADTLDFNLGLPVINGGSFYYFLEGNLEVRTDYQAILQVRLSIEEVLPFINPEGPFKSYLKIEFSNANHSRINPYNHQHAGIQCLQIAESLQMLDGLVENLSGKSYSNQTVHISSAGRSAIDIEIGFNKQGNPRFRTTMTPNQTIPKDSVVYTYYSNGKLKKVDFYELKKGIDSNGTRYQFMLNHVENFDPQQNKVEYINYEDGFVADGEYYTYIGDRVIIDHNNQFGRASGYYQEAHEYVITKGAVLPSQNNNQVPLNLQYTSRMSGDTTFIECTNERRTEVYLWYIQQNDLVTEIMENYGKSHTKITYDQLKRPTSYSLFGKTATGFVPYISASVAYDSKNRITRYTYQYLNGNQNPNLPIVYQFQYE